MHINKKNTFVNTLINHIKETNTERYEHLAKNLKQLFSNQLNKDINIIIYNDNILLSNH